MKRRKFLKDTISGITSSTLISASPLGAALISSACTSKERNETTESIIEKKSTKPKISLAQWSMHRAIENNEADPVNFAAIASKDYGINALEYVATFYKDNANDEMFWQDLKQRADDLAVENLLIMVDNEGNLGDPDEAARMTAVENHYKWVNAAKILGCHSIRINAFGSDDEMTLKEALTDGLVNLADYAAKENINILIENHGLFSSNAAFIVEVIKQANKPNIGTLPDFGNWCTSAKWGNTMISCNQIYNRYKGVAEFLPYAKGVSAKSYNFNENGDDAIIDYYKMMKIVKESGFEGYIGIEYEGNVLSEPEGIKATKALIEKSWAQA